MVMTRMQRRGDDNQVQEVVWHRAPSLLFTNIVTNVIIIIIATTITITITIIITITITNITTKRDLIEYHQKKNKALHPPLNLLGSGWVGLGGPLCFLFSVFRFLFEKKHLFFPCHQVCWWVHGLPLVAPVCLFSSHFPV